MRLHVPLASTLNGAGRRRTTAAAASAESFDVERRAKGENYATVWWVWLL